MLWQKEENDISLEYDNASSDDEFSDDDCVSTDDEMPAQKRDLKSGISFIRISKNNSTLLPGLEFTIESYDKKINDYLIQYEEPLCKAYQFKRNEIDENGCSVFVFPKDSNFLIQIINYIQTEKILCKEFCENIKNKIVELVKSLTPAWLTADLASSIHQELNSETVLKQVKQLDYYDHRIQIYLIYGDYLVAQRNKFNIPIHALLDWYLSLNQGQLFHAKNRQQFEKEIDSMISFLNTEKKRLYTQGALVGLLGVFKNQLGIEIPNAVIKTNIAPYLRDQDGMNIAQVCKSTLKEAKEHSPLLLSPGIRLGT